MKIIWSRRAIKHLVHVRDYIAQDSPEAAGQVAQKILDAVDQLTQHPNFGRPGRLPGTRELVVSETPYIIPYRVRGNRVGMIAVFHGRQRWPDVL